MRLRTGPEPAARVRRGASALGRRGHEVVPVARDAAGVAALRQAHRHVECGLRGCRTRQWRTPFPRYLAAYLGNSNLEQIQKVLEFTGTPNKQLLASLDLQSA